MKTCIAIAILLAPATAITVGGITKCQTGKTDLVGSDTNVFTVQVCNLFGATCYMNQLETAPGDCAAKALKIENLQCALFPIMSYKNNARTDATQLQVGSGSSGCKVSCSGTDCKFSGSCVSVQCSLGSDPVAYAGPGMTKTGTKSARTVGVTNTAATDAFQANDFASIAVSGSKTVLLSRTGNYVGTYSSTAKSGTNTYNFGKLPTIDGTNYGPKACPSATTLVSASKVSKEELRVCGATGKWVYFGAANLLMDKSMYAKYSADSATGLASTKKNIAKIPFLHGESSYRSGAAMDDSRAVYLHDGATTSASILMTSQTISPSKSTSAAMGTQQYAGQWRFYTVVFYCDNYARTDLTACPGANQKMFYVADPNPAPAFGITAAAVGAGSSGGGTAGSSSGGGTAGASGSSAYTRVGNGACVDSAGKHGSFDKTTTSSKPHTNCQAKCTADATCTGYDSRASGCLYYKIQIVKSNDVATTYQCYKKSAASPAPAPAPTPAVAAPAPAAGGQFAGSAAAGLLCSSGFMALSGEPLCATPYEAGCSKATCCKPLAKCSFYSTAWIAAALVNGGCEKNNAKDFFDRKKLAVTVAAPQGDAQIKAACCTPYSSAKCSDWAGVHSCAAGTVLQNDNSAAPDGTDGKSFSALSKFRVKCCAAPPVVPKTCADYRLGWIAAALLNGGCAKDNAKDFFDLKKVAVTVVAPQGDAQIKAACCTPFSSAKCSDWAGVYGCLAGTALLSTDAAAPDGSDGKTFSTVAKFRQVCCNAPMKCSAYTGTQSVSGAIMHTTSLWIAAVGVVAMWVL